MKFVIALVVLAILVLQVEYNQGTPITLVQRTILDDAIVKAKKNYKKLEKRIQKRLGQPAKEIKDLSVQLENRIVELEARIVANSKESLSRILNGVQAKIDIYREASGKLSVDMDECYQESKDKMTSLPEELIVNISRCATEEYERGMTITLEACDLVNRLMSSVNQVPERIANCTKLSFVSATTCLGGDLNSLTYKTTNEILPRMNDITSTVMIFLTGVQPRVQECAALTLISSGKLASDISIKFVNCVTNKFRRSKSRRSYAN